MKRHQAGAPAGTGGQFAPDRRPTVDVDLVAAAGGETCSACGRPELECLLGTCPDVIADRDEEEGGEEDETCSACGRPELECSQVPCPDVSVDREETLDALAAEFEPGSETPDDMYARNRWAAARAARALRSVEPFGARDSRDVIQDALSDLHHLAARLGVDFGDVMESAEGVYDDELKD